MTRDEAIKSGLHKYEADQPCKWGHAPFRYTATGKCIGCNTAYSKTLRRKEGRKEEEIATCLEHAKTLGLSKYLSGRPCVHWHEAVRYTNTGACVGCSSYAAKTKRRNNPRAKEEVLLERADAAILGLNKYRANQPCRRGHDAIRYTGTGACVKCVSGHGRVAGRSDIVSITERVHRDDAATITEIIKNLWKARA